MVIVLTIFALLIRLPYIHNPKQVVFDEVHFGGFANKYISRKFFMGKFKFKLKYKLIFFFNDFVHILINEYYLKKQKNDVCK